MISVELLTRAKLCNAETAAKWVLDLDATCIEFEINTPLRIAGFLSQCAHESNYFRSLQENLNYSEQGLLKVFPKNFTPELAAQYEHQPEKIASRVYANRMGNGDEASGDGWKYRGRGILQITGKNNYAEFEDYYGGEKKILDNPDLLSTPDYAAPSAGWFWRRGQLNTLADNQDVINMTKRINGGTNGLETRQMLYNQVLSVFGKN
jgi:putative chitinase